MSEHKFTAAADNSRIPGTQAGRDGVHFGYFASSGKPVLLLYRKGSEEVEAEIPFPEPPAAGNFYSMKVQLAAEQYEYNFFDGGKVVTDPYAKRVAGRKGFGQELSASPHSLRGAFVTGAYRWDGDRLPRIPFDEAVMYHLHVRGFTMHAKSGARKKGTFAGLRAKIPYLKALGVNQVKLMPVYEFAELMPLPQPSGAPQTQQEAVSRALQPEQEQSCRMNYWGYGPGFYFAPKASYAAGEREDTEFRDMVKAFHANGMEVLLEFSFSDETDIGMICDCLNYWAEEYHIDGFSILGRDRLAPELSQLPLFRSRKLICGWYPQEVTGRNQKDTMQKLAQSNDSFMNDCRRLLKGDADSLQAFSRHLRRNPQGCAQINYITNHDGFTLADLVSYDRKHNEANGEGGYDGPSCDFSWNCGEEGPSGRREVLRLRMRQRKNAYAMLLFSQGTPMLLAGDEFGNSQDGNNNPYCHDSELTWTDWGKSRTGAGRELTEFVQRAIAFRRAHRVLHRKTEPSCTDSLACGYPDLSFHSERAWYGNFDRAYLHTGCMYSGYYTGEKGFLYLAWNFHWEEERFALPLLPAGYSWFRVMDTSLKNSFPDTEQQENLKTERSFAVPPRTVVILEGREDETAKTPTSQNGKSDHLGKGKGTPENDHGA